MFAWAEPVFASGALPAYVLPRSARLRLPDGTTIWRRVTRVPPYSLVACQLCAASNAKSAGKLERGRL
jgi:hypothetical protein